MSKRNSQEAKRAARERLRAERERQAKKDKVRRQLTVGGVTVLVLAVAAGIALAVSTMGGDSKEEQAWKDAKKAKLVKPENTADVNGTTIVIGDSKAPTLEIYEDPRCPTCAAFEQASGETVKQDLEAGKYKASFTFGTFIDDMAGVKGTGSKNALSALGAALNVSTDAFLDLKVALYSEKNHPRESDDKFADDDYLLKIAEEVPDLKGNAQFEKDVKNGTFDRWAVEMSEKFDNGPATGTPTFRMFSEKLVVEGAQEGTPIITPEQLHAAVDKAIAENAKGGEGEKSDKDAKDGEESEK